MRQRATTQHKTAMDALIASNGTDREALLLAQIAEHVENAKQAERMHVTQARISQPEKDQLIAALRADSVLLGWYEYQFVTQK